MRGRRGSNAARFDNSAVEHATPVSGNVMFPHDDRRRFVEEPFAMQLPHSMAVHAAFPPAPPRSVPYHHPAAAAAHHVQPLPAAALRNGAASVVANDYCQNFVNTGKRPQNFITDADLNSRYAEYPRMRELVERKDALVDAHRHPAYCLQADLKTLPLSVETFGTKFDVILIDPPWPEYVRRVPAGMSDGVSWDWQEVRDLNVRDIADEVCFVFLWCGSAEGLEAGRHCLKAWGFRRCEDICWVKCNKDGSRKHLMAANQEPYSVLTRTKEHCLMGIRGDVRRSVDGHIVHSNIDVDVIVSEEPPLHEHTRKPVELYSIIERFCLGTRRLELFGEDHNMRAGWLTVGKGVTSSNFSVSKYISHFMGLDGHVYSGPPRSKPPANAPHLLGTTAEIENLRPKSPTRQSPSQPVSGLSF